MTTTALPTSMPTRLEGSPPRRRGKPAEVADATAPAVADDAAASPPVATATSAPRKPQGKSATVLKLLARARGATLAEIGAPTGWQPHSTRAFLSGLRKKGMGVVREPRRTGETAYRIGGPLGTGRAEGAAAGEEGIIARDGTDASAAADGARIDAGSAPGRETATIDATPATA